MWIAGGDLAKRRGATLVPVSGGPSSPALANHFRDLAQRVGAENVIVSFRGPKGLLEHVRAVMRDVGAPQDNLHYEHFEFR